MATKKPMSITSNPRSGDKSSKTSKIAAIGIETGPQFARLMSALMSDIISGKIPPQIANATCNAGGKLLKIVEMQYKYGGKLNLQLAPPKDGEHQQ